MSDFSENIYMSDIRTIVEFNVKEGLRIFKGSINICGGRKYSTSK